jgi:hypothetical protein
LDRRQRATLEKRLPRVIRDVEAIMAAEEEARQEAQRRHEDYLAEQRRKEEEQRRQWQTALDEARPKAVEVLRRKAFRAAYDAWVAAGEMRAFCNALESCSDGRRLHPRRRPSIMIDLTRITCIMPMCGCGTVESVDLNALL